MTVGEYFKLFHRYHISTLSFILLNGGVLLFLYFNRCFFHIDKSVCFFIHLVAVLFILALVGGGKRSFQKQLTSLRSLQDKHSRFSGYRKNMVRQYRNAGLCAVIISIGFVLTGNIYYLILLILCFLFTLSLVPSRIRLGFDLGFDGDERKKLCDRNNDHEEI